MWNLQQAPVEESQHKLPDFWSKARNSREIFFEKHLCVLLGFNTEHLTMEHILFWYLKLPIISLILLDQISHDIRQAQI